MTGVQTCALPILLNQGASLLWCSRLPPRAFRVEKHHTTIPSGCVLIANSSPLPRSALQTPHSSTQPPCTPVDSHLRAGLGLTGLCRSHFVLPATDWLLGSPPRPRGSPFVPADLPTSEGTSQGVETFPSSLLGVQVLSQLDRKSTRLNSSH